MRYVLLLLFVISHEIYPLTFFNTKENHRKEVVKLAESLIETQYRFGGKKPSGFDCSGFTRYVYSKACKINLAASSNLQSRQGKKVSLKKCKVGDLIFFANKKKISHVGVINRKNKKGIWMIHSSSSKGVISEEITHSNYWNSRIVVIKSHF